MRKIRRRAAIDILRGRLTAAQLESIRQDNPFRGERNELIRSLYLRGVELPLLTALTGMSKNAVYRIATTEFNRYIKRKTIKNAEGILDSFLKSKIKRLQRSLNKIKRVNEHHVVILNDLVEFLKLREKAAGKESEHQIKV